MCRKVWGFKSPSAHHSSLRYEWRAKRCETIFETEPMNLLELRPENLEPLLQAAQTIAEGYQLKVVSGWLSDGRYAPQVNWQFDGDRTIQEFLGFAAKQGCGFVLIDPIRVNRGDVEAAFDRPTMESLRDKMKLSGRVGQLALLRLLFVSSNPTTIHSLELLAEWYALVFPEDPRHGLGATLNDLSPEEMQEAADRLARDSRFHETTNRTQREYVARKIFAAELKHDELYPLEDVVAQASQIYESEIRPEVEAKLAEEAQKLYDSGVSRGDIARRLNLSLFRLSRLI